MRRPLGAATEGRRTHARPRTATPPPPSVRCVRGRALTRAALLVPRLVKVETGVAPFGTPVGRTRAVLPFARPSVATALRLALARAEGRTSSPRPAPLRPLHEGARQPTRLPRARQAGGAPLQNETAETGRVPTPRGAHRLPSSVGFRPVHKEAQRSSRASVGAKPPPLAPLPGRAPSTVS